MDNSFTETIMTVKNNRFDTIVNGKRFWAPFGNVAIPITKLAGSILEPQGEYVTPGFRELFMGGVTGDFGERCRYEDANNVPIAESSVKCIMEWLKRMDVVWGGGSHDEMDVNILYGWATIKDDGNIAGELAPLTTPICIMKGVHSFAIPSNFIKIRTACGCLTHQLFQHERFNTLRHGVDATLRMMNHPYGSVAGDVFAIGGILYFGSLENVIERVSKLHYWNRPDNEQSPLSNKFHVVGEPSNISSLI